MIYLTLNILENKKIVEVFEDVLNQKIKDLSEISQLEIDSLDFVNILFKMPINSLILVNCSVLNSSREISFFSCSCIHFFFLSEISFSVRCPSISA